MNKKFYVTTPIYYPNDKLHIGHAYTTTLADYISKYKKLQGYETMFITGSDEHGQKIADKAKEAGMEPLSFITPIITSFKNLWFKLNIDYDVFIRTTDSIHTKYVSDSFTYFMKKDFIYKSKYTDLYCISDEAYFTKTQSPNGICPVCGNKLISLSEESYFLKISGFKEWIKEKLLNSNLLTPKYRVVELINNFVDELQDLSISRTSFSWGIKINEDELHIIYVWLDALQCYITALKYPGSKFSVEEVWNKNSNVEILQLVGKEIIRFHCIYWPIMLEMKNYRETVVVAHGWLITDNGQKMSKSKGNVVDPIKLINLYGSDSLKFYLINNIVTGDDGKFSQDLLEEMINSILVNKYSNLVARTDSMVKKYFNGIVPENNSSVEETIILRKKLKIIRDDYFSLMDKFKFSDSTKELVKYMEELNGFIDKTEPWKVKGRELESILNTLVNEIFNITLLLSSILDITVKKVFDWLNYKNSPLFDDLGRDFYKTHLNDIEHLFERIERK